MPSSTAREDAGPEGLRQRQGGVVLRVVGLRWVASRPGEGCLETAWHGAGLTGVRLWLWLRCFCAQEKQKLKEEHPGEVDYVICKSPESCYVKGRLQPSRSLGTY